MKISVVYDNETIKSNLFIGHGFSALLEDKNFSLIFDTGWNGPILLKNLDSMKKDINKIKYVFLSHQHWDHIGGVPDLLDRIGHKVIFVIPYSFTSGLKKELSKYGSLIEVGKEPYEFADRYFSTGEMSSSIGIKEHALFIDSKKRILLVGCAHPDVYKILQKTGKVDILIGGFHDFSRIELLEDMVNEIIFPCHCTKKKKEILNFYKNKSKRCGTGLEVEI